MKRYYYISKSLEDTDNIHQQLINKDIDKNHIHVYGLSDEVAQAHDFNPVLSIFKSDVIHYILRGILIGLALSIVLSLGFALFAPDILSFLPFIILFSALLTGFISWEAGLIGLHKQNYKFVPFSKMLNKSNHLVMIDVLPEQSATLIDILDDFKNVKAVAVGSNIINPFEEQETLLPRS